MLYVAHFELSKPDENEDGPDLSIGYFSCVAEADDIDGAMDKFENIITKQREEGRLFEGPGARTSWATHPVPRTSPARRCSLNRTNSKRRCGRPSA